ncbi:hypothetical protein WMY93_006382 [Mugilogobius chulae]|uniref:PH domain-containing protein n=1 Tax=Mugilogobius chulae TaxID=88201 RepID=A0AAW0PTB9_9GOBI
MSPPTLDYYCRGFQPNTFDPSRCGTCLRPDHMHLNNSTVKEDEWEDSPLDPYDDECDLSEVTSVSSDDISGGWTYEWSLGHSLSPDQELNTCDTDIQPRSPASWDCSCRSRSLSSEKSLDDMTRFDPSPHRSAESPWMDERRGRDRSRRPSESTGNRERGSGFFSPDRRENSEKQTDENNKRRYRYFERGHPLPSNYVPEPKACVPFRTVNLGLPSRRRNSETFMQDSWRSESPQRYTNHSNFRRGADSQTTSPTRHNSVSPDRHKSTESSVGHRRGSSISRGQSRSRVPSQHPSQHPSHTPSRYSSRCSSPSRRRPSISQAATPSHNRTANYNAQNGDYNVQNRSNRGSGTPSQSSHRHSLDSEKLYKNLEYISHRSSPPIQQRSCEGSSNRTAVNSAVHTHTHNSRDNTPQKEYGSRDSRLSPSQGSWQGSAHSFLSNPASRGSSTSLRNADTHLLGPEEPVSCVTDAPEENRAYSDRSRSSGRRGMDALLISEPKKTSEVVEEVGMTIDDYIELADIPKIYLESEEEYVGHRKRNQSPSPCRNQRTRSERYTDETDMHSSRLVSDDRGRVRERGRDRREKCRDYENGRPSRRQSMGSVHSQSSDNLNGKQRSSKAREHAASEQPQTQGWLSILDEHGKWRKHWFVLGKCSVRYYRDSEGEEFDDLEGEIDLRSCLNVSDCSVEKNYGFQLQTKKAVFTLCAMTSRIRRNWVKLLKQAIQNKSHQSDSGSEKENPLSQRRSSCQPSAQFTEKESRHKPAALHTHQDLSQREEGEGWDREQAKRLEERNKWFEEGLSFNEMCSRWDSMELKKGSVPIPVIDTIDTEVNRKWSEFEKFSFREMTAQSIIGNGTLHSNSQTFADVPNGFTHEESIETFSAAERTDNYVSNSFSLTNESENNQTSKADVLHKEAISLRKEVESIKKERAAMGIEVESPCGPGAPCRIKLEALVADHQKELQELQEKHEQEVRKLKEQRDNMLKEESRTAAEAMEKLKAAHKEEMKRVMERAKESKGGAIEPVQNVSQAYALHGELDVLSERYSQKCLELKHAENNGESRDTDLRQTEKELEQLRSENQELKARLAEEISRMRYFITGQKSDMEPVGSSKTYAQIETLLKTKENEILSLRREISCLQNEVHSLTKEKENAYERYKGIYVQLTNTQGHNQLEKNSLMAQLELANAALQEDEQKT